MSKKGNSTKALASKLNNSIKQTILLIISLTLLFPYLAFANDIIIDNNASKSNQPQITPATKQTILSLITASSVNINTNIREVNFINNKETLIGNNFVYNADKFNNVELRLIGKKALSNTDNKVMTNKEYSSILNQKPDIVDNTINEIRDGLNNPAIITETFMIANDILNDSMPPSTFKGSIYNIIDKQENLYDGINTIKNTISK